jgi:hypothetical protein
MDILYEHTLKKQLEEQKKQLEAQGKEMRAMEERLSSLIKGGPASFMELVETEDTSPGPLSDETKLVTAPCGAKMALHGAKAMPYGAKAAPNNTKIVAKAAFANTANRGMQKVVATMGAVVDASVGKTVTINVFGKENTSHITHADIWRIFKQLSPIGDDMRKTAERAILAMAMMIFSDEKHMENITCYTPNKKGKEALIHGEKGWEVMPMSLVMSPIASRSVDELFAKQPVLGGPGVEEDVTQEKIDEAARVLKYIMTHEGDLVNEAAASELRAVPIRNKDILHKILENLPVKGSK